jgi:hypothetical protein
MGVLVEPLPTFAGPSNEEVTLFHNYRLNGEKTARLLHLSLRSFMYRFSGSLPKTGFT